MKGQKSTLKKYRAAGLLVVFALTSFALPAKTEATLQDNANTIERVERLINGFRLDIGDVTSQQAIDLVGAQLAQRLGIEGANIPNALSKIEGLRTLFESYANTGGNPTPVINAIESFLGNEAPQIQSLAQLSRFGDISNFGNVLNFVKSRVPAEAAPFIDAVVQGGDGIRNLAISFATQKIGEALTPQLSSILSTLQGGLSKVPAGTGGLFGGGFGQLIDNFLTPDFQETAKTVLEGSFDLLGGTSDGLIAAASSIAGVDSLFAQASAIFNALPDAIQGILNPSGQESLISQQGAGPENCSVTGGSGASGGIGASVAGAAGGKLKQGLAGLTQGFLNNVTNSLSSFLGNSGATISSAAGLGGGGKGVPVIEQKGELLTATTQNRTINLQSCNLLSAILNVITTKKIEARIESVQISLQAAEATIDQNNQYFISDHARYERDEQLKQYKKKLEEVKESAPPELKRALTQYVAIKSSMDDKGELKGLFENRQAPTAGGLSHVLALTQPASGPIGASLQIKTNIAREANEALVRARDEINRNNSFQDPKKCFDPNHNPQSGEDCNPDFLLRVQSGATIRDSNTFAYTVPTRLGISAEGIKSNPPQLKQALGQQPARITQGGVAPPPGEGQRILESIIEEGEQATTGGSDDPGGFGDLLAFYRALCRISSSLPFCGDIQEPPSGGGGGGGGQEPPPPPPVNPTLTLSTSTEHIAGNTFTRISWQTNGVTQCFTNNNWNSYGNGDNPSLDLTTLIADGTAIGPNGAAAIFHPAIFRANASAVEGADNLNNIVPPSQVSAITNRVVFATVTTPVLATTVTQSSVFTPNISNVEEDDIITFGLNGLFVGVFASTTSQEGTSDNVRSALTSTELDQARADEYANYAVNGTSSVHVVRGLEIAGVRPVDDTFNIRCIGQNQSTLTDSTKIRFVGDI